MVADHVDAEKLPRRQTIDVGATQSFGIVVRSPPMNEASQPPSAFWPPTVPTNHARHSHDRSADNGKQLPDSGNTFEFVLASIFELKARSCY
jgi:hypothetical protein